MTQKISFVSPSFGWFLDHLSLFSRRAKSSARESFGNEYVSIPSEGRNTYLVDELQTTNVFGSLIRELDGVHRQRRGRLQRDDRRGDEGDALFFFQFFARGGRHWAIFVDRRYGFEQNSCKSGLFSCVFGLREKLVAA